MWCAAMTKPSNPSYEVGYGKPPVHSRFRKGQSGNPKGRAKGSRNFSTIFSEAMMKPVVITENGQRKKISKLATAMTQLANDAARGDKKSIQLAFAMLQALETAAQGQENHDENRDKVKVVFSGVLAKGDRTV
jgi:Family of unknown function (DUF5681)